MQHLRRVWRSVPLQRLHQGSTLTIRASGLASPTAANQIHNQNVLPTTHVVLQPAWRDDGHAEFQQILPSSSSSADGAVVAQMVVRQEEDAMTSLGRVASHVSIELQQEVAAAAAASSPDGKDWSSGTTDASKEHPNTAEHGFIDTVPQSSPKPIDRVILDDGTITPVENVSNEIPADSSRTDYHDGIAHIHKKHSGDDAQEKPAGIYLNVRVPEKVNVVCDLQSCSAGSITVTDKIEGDVRLCVNGDIRVKKLRGNTIELKNDGAGSTSRDAIIYVSGLLEAQTVQVETRGRFRAKQIHGRSIDIAVEHTAGASAETGTRDAAREDEDDEGSLVDVSSMFVSGNGLASVRVRGDRPLQRRAVRIKSHHGFITVSTDGVPKPEGSNEMTGQIYPLVELGGVNGSCEVTVDNVVATEPETTPAGDDSDGWPSSLVHIDSLSPESVSFVAASQGDIAMTLDRKVEADLRLLSVRSPGTAPNVPWTEIGPLLVDDDEHDKLIVDLRQQPHLEGETSNKQEHGRVSIQTKAFTAQSSFTAGTDDRISYVDGWVENKSQEPDSRFERKTRGVDGSVGKIRLDGAADQALEAFSSDASKKDDDGPVRPLLAVAGTQNITLETVSWLGAIARRYGLDEETRKRDLGRTASRRGRPIAPSPSDE